MQRDQIQTLEQSDADHRNLSNQERWLSMLGGALALGVGLRASKPAAAPMAALGTALLLRGASGYCPISDRLGRRSRSPNESGLLGNERIRLRQAITIDVPPIAVYRYWRDLEKLPEVLRHLRRVKMDNEISHWTANGPLGLEFNWDVVIREDHPGRRLAWQALGSPGHSGAITLRPRAGGHNTLLDVELEYRPPGGALGRTLCTRFGGFNNQQLAIDLAHLKQRIEHWHHGAPARARPPAGADVPDQGLGREPISPAHG